LRALWAGLFLLISFGLWSQDTLIRPVTGDTSRTDSLVLIGQTLYVLSSDSIAEPVDYTARDSMVFDYQGKWLYLYGAASIKYQTMTIQADFIRVDLNASIAYADPLMDSLGRKTGLPKFQDQSQSFDAQSMKYNFKTRKGSISGVVTKEAELFILGEKTKFIASTGEGTRVDDIIFNKNGIFTTCDHPEPHFGIYSKKQKVIPNKMVIVGPSILKIKEIPAPPFMLPFGFFPISKNRSAGLIFPRNYDFDPRYGFGLRQIGYYIPISEYLDLKVLSDVWFKGSLSATINGNYKKKYKHSGSFILTASNLREELPNDYRRIVKRPIRIFWSHNQDQGAHPYRTFSGSIDLSTNSFDRVVFQDAQSRINSTLYSSLNFSYQFPNSPFSIVTGFQHNQNLNTRIINITLPSLDVRMRAQTPFKSKKKISAQPKWYELITVNYNSSLRNSLSTYDSLLWQRRTLDTLRYGMRHTVTADASFRILKYISLTPGINYNEEWFFRKGDRFLKDTIIERKDTSGTILDSIFGLQITDISRGFYALRTINASVNLNTQIYGQLLSSKGWFRGVRHVMAPTVNLGFAPDYGKSPFNYMAFVDTDTRPDRNRQQRYLRYQNSAFGTTGVPDENFVVNFSLNNRVEMKYFSKKDSVSKKLSLIDNFVFSGNYNVFKDSFKLSRITGSGQTTLFKGITRLSYSVTFDPYQRVLVNGVEQSRDVYLIRSDKKLANLVQATLGIANNTSIPQIIRLFSKDKQSSDPLPGLTDILSSFNISHNMQYSITRLKSGKDTLTLDYNSISTSGSIPITKNWSVQVGQIGYDFKLKGLTYPDIGLTRNLHCWIMRFSYYPQLGAFSFFIGVNPGPLDFIKIPSNQGIVGSR